MRKNDAFVAKIINTRLMKIFIAIFAPNERLPSSAPWLGLRLGLGIHDDGEEQSNLLELDVHDDHDHPDGQGGGLHGSHQESSIPGETGLYLSGGRFLLRLDFI